MLCRCNSYVHQNIIHIELVQHTCYGQQLVEDEHLLEDVAALLCLTILDCDR